MAETADAFLSRVATFLGDTDQDIYTDALMLPWLHDSFKILDRQRVIRRTRSTAKVAGQFEYDMPDGFAQAIVVLFRHSADFYPLHRSRIRSVYARREIRTSGQTTFYDVWGNAHPTRTTGTATGGSITTCQDTTKDFTTGSDLVLIGDIFQNTSDGSEGTVTAVAATQLTFSAGLIGGIENDVDATETYKVLNPSATLKNLVLDPAPDTTDDTGEESIQVLYNARHRTITSADLTNNNDDIEYPDELHDALFYQMLYYGRLYETDIKAVADMKVLYQNEIADVEIDIQRDIEEFISAYSDGAVLRGPNITGSARSAISWQ